MSRRVRPRIWWDTTASSCLCGGSSLYVFPARVLIEHGADMEVGDWVGNTLTPGIRRLMPGVRAYHGIMKNFAWVVHTKFVTKNLRVRR
eukprot:COSAG02_NODE_651_length_18910_cov_12.561639_4_plen_89_part_00